MEHLDIYDRMMGCLCGQAIGDALGLGAEFMSKEEVKRFYPDGLKRYDQIIQDSHRRRWPIGAWTDDTDMMLCILTAFDGVEFNTRETARNFKRWLNGDAMGIGSHTYKVLSMSDYVLMPEECSKFWWDLSRQRSAANGALMRTSVVGLVGNNVDEQAERICLLTHYDPRCVGSCVIVSEIIHNIVWNSIELSYAEIKELGQKYDGRIGEWIDIAYESKDITDLRLDERESMGYTLRSLSAALWCYWHSPSFEDGLITIVNEGGDADTNAAIACAVLGAKYGCSGIPSYYIEHLHKRDEYMAKCKLFSKLAIARLT
ncbi:MAG: ADP-ribosylglycohydrolase family protein [Duncaniella sp.]|nr:ADP-ribosylglycohydrolase family protein [Duncaniella sp.]